MFPLILGIAIVMILIERLWPAHQLPSSRGWWLRVALVNGAQLGIVMVAGLTWDRWMAGASLFSISHALDDWTAGFIAYFFSTFVYYFWHRIRHESGLFWRLCHQLHHSPRRIELLASFYKHPVEIVLNALISSSLVYLILGCSVQAAAIYTLFAAVAEYFYHWNIRTPRWLGWIIQRPESHRVHHKYQHHSQNYADLPVWDWIFGTLDNPKKSPTRCGFDADREQRVIEMLAFRDVHKTPQGLPIQCFGCRKRWACLSGKQPVAELSVRQAQPISNSHPPSSANHLRALPVSTFRFNP